MKKENLKKGKEDSFTLFESKAPTRIINKLCAFTLAEVLITLAIIGVVAALTIPTVVKNYKKLVIETRLKKTYAELSQAVNMSLIDNGMYENWELQGITRTMTYEQARAWFDKYLAPYLKIQKIEQSGTSRAFYVYLANGTILQFEMFDATFDLFLYIDKNAVTNSIRGKNYFAFTFRPLNPSKLFYHKGIEPYAYGWDGDMEKLKYGVTYSCYDADALYYGKYCTKVIQLNGWKIPDDYPWL